MNVVNWPKYLVSFFRNAYYNRLFSKVDYFNIEELIKFPDMSVPNPIGYNVSYGLNRPVEKLGNTKVNLIHDYIEHGLLFSSDCFLLEHIMSYRKINRVFTYSKERAEKISARLGEKGKDIEILSLGPFIIGSKNFHTQNALQRIKKKLGRVLLVFPMHSWTGVENSYEEDSFVKEIENHRKEFDTILICMYYLDIQKGKHKYYSDKGYTIVCNGSRFDANFIKRHKDLIDLSDMTMSNGIGSHIGYCICLNKPHYYFKQKMSIMIDSKVKASQNEEMQFRNQLEDEIVKLFGAYKYEISNEQIHFVQRYWGNY